MAGVGRPSVYTPELADEICTRLANGESLRAICNSERDDFMPSIGTILRWVGENDEFQQQYARAREIQAETHADDIVTIADGAAGDDSVKTARDRLRVDARKWVASKLLPKKYGDKQTTVLEDANGNNPFMALMEAVSNNGRPRPSS